MDDIPDDVAEEARVKLADLLVNKALECDRRGYQNACTAHLHVAMKVMFPEFSKGPIDAKP